VTQLFPYQLEGASFLAARKGALLADEPRVGKTWPAIVASDYTCAENVLWITKGSARADHRRAWQTVQVLNRPVTSIYSGSDRLPDYGVIVISYDLATGAFFQELLKRDFDVIVLDEAHRVKSLDARRTQRILGRKAELMGGLAERAEYGWALTGTPFPNHYAEIYPVARALFSEALRTSKGIMNYHQFENRFCILRDNGFGMKIVGNKNAAELHDRLAPHMLRRKFNEVWPDASRPVVDRIFLEAQAALDELTDEERDLIKEEFAPMLRKAEGDAAKTDAIMREIEKRIGPRLQRLTGEAKALPLAEWITDQIESSSGKVVVFAWHRSVIDLLAKALAKFKPIVIDGRTTGRQKDDYQQAFMHDPTRMVAIGQIVAAGEAIDLSAADTLIFAEASWSAGDNDQAWRRIVNVNKRSALLVLFATLADSIDEDVQRAHERKLRDAALVYDRVA
jgi:SWI/SNF-related matrix-associated actin-dependent regulator 1 of chromatin subfamily A